MFFNLKITINLNKIEYSKVPPEPFLAFEMTEDPRTEGNTKHHFGEVLFMLETRGVKV